MRTGVFLSLLLAAGSACALNVGDRSRFECRQGNCMNGQGVVWDAALQVNMQGNWSNGHTIPGATYTVTLPIAPGKQFRQVYGQDGLLESGDSPRSIGVFHGVVPTFRGSYGRVQHAFLRQPMAVIKEGVYDTGIGIEYRGRFEYLSAKSGMQTGWGSGYFIFYGERVDTEEDETETGLFISDETPGGAAVRFVKADPSYLALLQQKYQRDMQLAQGEFQQQESEKKWRSALSMIGNIGLALAAGQGGIGKMGGSSNVADVLGAGLLGGQGSLGAMNGGDLAGNIAMGLVSSMFNQGGADVNIGDLASQVIGSAVGSNNPLGNALVKVATLQEGEGGADAVMQVFADAMINRTGNAIVKAAGQSGSNIGMQIGTAVLNSALTPAAPAASARTAPGDPGVVQLAYTPGKGFLDPVTGQYIRKIEDMSCDNVTSRGVRIRDLPPAQRTCVEAARRR